jgi:hypothetical protein
MHKYFNFTKIFEAEQMGMPLSPEEMGTPEAPIGSVPDEKIEDFALLAKENLLEITVTKDDFDKLKMGQSVQKTDAQWKNKENETEIKGVKLVIINTKNDTSKNEPDSLVFNLDDTSTTDIIEGIKLGNVTQVLKGFGQDGTEIPDITVRFIKSVDIDTSPDLDTVPATPEQVESGAVLPEPVEDDMPNESRGIMSFNQFVNEGKKNLKDVLDKKGKKKEDLDKTKKAKSGKKFPDMSGDGKVTKKDILIAKGVIKK